MQRIEGLSIGLSIDTLKVDSGLTDLKRKLSLVNSEMKANLSAFDRSENSLDKYQVKIDGLNKKLDVQRKVTENARKHYEKMVKEHGEGSAEAEKAARAYNNEVAKLNNLERQIKDVASQMKEFQRQQKIQNSTLFKTGDSLVKFGSGLKSISDKTKDLGKNLTKKLTLPAVGAASALAGIALKKGFDRLVGIDNARAKLKGLGHDAKGVEKIMDSALESVKGTSFGMDEAATTAANAVAAGVKEGKELTRYLSLTGDAAAIAGASMSEMGSILNKVQTSNKAYNGELRQLADRGLPVYVWLEEEAKKAGMTVEEMASKGMISSEMLMNAIEKNIGGAAKKMGEESFTAGIANAWAAVGRLGASFLDAGGKGGGFFSQLKPLIAEFTGRIDTMGEYAEKAGVKFGEMFTGFIDKVKSVKSWFDNLSPSMQDVIKKGALIGTVVTVGIGPALVGLSMFGGMIANISTGLGGFLKLLAPLTAGLGGAGKAAGAAGAAAGTAGKSVGLLGRAFTFLGGPVGITIGIIALLTTGFITAYKKSETFRNFIHKLGEKLKEVFFGIVDFIKPGLDAVLNFFGEIKSQITGFMNAEGSQLTAAFQNIGSVISIVAGAIWTAVKWAFEKILSVIKFVMPLALAIIKMVWENIKGVISGALKIIMGLVQVFSGLFTGNFSKMWEGVKNIFSGAIQFVWNLLQLMFWGRIVKGVVSFAKLFGNTIRGMWGNVKNIFSTVIKWIVDFVKNRFTSMSNTTRNIFNGIQNIANRIWNAILNLLRTIITAIFNVVRNIFTNMRNTISSIFNAIRNTATTIWNGIKDRIVTPIRNAVNTARERFSSLRTNISNIFSNIRKNVSDYVSRMVQTVRDMPGRMADGIRKMGGKLYDAAKGIANKLVKGLGKGVNGVITGVNWVLDKLHVKSRLDPWPVPKYAHGTDGHPGGLAVVGDGKGNNAGQELVTTPDGQNYLSPAKPTLVNLPKGTHVLSAKETKSLIPHYAFGTGGMVKSAWKKTKDLALNVWSYVKEPGKLLNLGLEALGISKPDNTDTIGKIARGGFNFVKNKAVDYIKSAFTKAEQEGGNLTKPNFGGRFRFSSPFGMRWGRLHGGVDYAAPIGTPIPSQSGGRVSFASYGFNGGFGNLVKVKQGIHEHFYAHMSRIMARVGQSVSKGTILGLVGNTGRSTGPHVHYEVRKNGIRINPLSIGKGFATGGLIKSSGLYPLAEGGWPEYVIPTDPKRRTDAMKLLALAGREISGNKRPGQLPGVNSLDDGAISYLEKMVSLLSEQVSDMKEMIMLLAQLVAKNPNLQIGEHEFKIFVSKLTDKGLGEIGDKKKRAWGGV